MFKFLVENWKWVALIAYCAGSVGVTMYAVVTAERQPPDDGFHGTGEDAVIRSWFAKPAAKLPNPEAPMGYMPRSARDRYQDIEEVSAAGIKARGGR